MNSPIKLPPLPEPSIVSYQADSTLLYTELRTYDDADTRAYAEQAVRDALAAQVAKINAAMAAMSLDGVNGGPVQKEYFKAGARRAIQAVNSALIPENNHE